MSARWETRIADQEPVAIVGAEVGVGTKRLKCIAEPFSQARGGERGSGGQKRTEAAGVIRTRGTIYRADNFAGTPRVQTNAGIRDGEFRARHQQNVARVEGREGSQWAVHDGGVEGC